MRIACASGDRATRSSTFRSSRASGRLDDDRATIESLLPTLGGERDDVRVDIARLPLSIRGYGPVKERSVEAAKRRRAELLATLDAPRATEVRRAG